MLFFNSILVFNLEVSYYFWGAVKDLLDSYE